MKHRKTRISILTLIMFVVAGAMFAFGALNFGLSPYITGDALQGNFELDHVGVNLIEKSQGDKAYKDVGKKDGENGQLLTSLKDKNGNVKIAPGAKYSEKIAAFNSSDVPQYVRVVIHKYWMNADGSKDTSMDPELIHLTYGNKAYNTDSWKINPSETASETSVYYYTSELPAETQTPDLMNQLQIDPRVAQQYTEKTTQNDAGQTVITYVYKYDGKVFCVEAEAQALQPHNINDAIKSVWGVQNVTVSGGSLSIGQ